MYKRQKYDSANLNVNGADIKAYDSVTGEDVTAKFDIKVENGVITATSKADLTKSLGDAENTQVIDTTCLLYTSKLLRTVMLLQL